MSSGEPLLRPAEGGILTFWCPGCKCGHWVDPKRWTVSGPPEAPTISPSVLCRTGHYIPGHQGSCWCTFEGGKSRFACSVCHLFVRDGKIEFLSDSTHELAGRTVPMEPL